MLKIFSRAVGPYQVNPVLVWCDQTNEAVLFDPTAGSGEFVEEIEQRGLRLTTLVNTHGHLDHIAENGLVKARFNVPLLIHELDRPMLTDSMKNLSQFTGQPIISPDADGTLSDGDSLRVGSESLKVLHVPGHTPGSLAFCYPGWVITGDALFAGSIGRTDFPGSSERQLLESIQSKLLTLPDDTVIYPGHGPTTSTVGEEKRSNPFLRV
jgi:hydroxyacylglutathione hydrolase